MSASNLSIGMNGATGRMGARIIALIQEGPSVFLGAALERADHPAIGRDVGEVLGLGPLGVALRDTLEGPLDAMIDFSSPAGTMAIARACAEMRVPLVIGTTGLGPEHRAELKKLSSTIPILPSSNFSKAVNLLMRLSGEAAKALGDAADIEIVERHHRFKKDAPSGTALRLAEIVGEAIGSQRYAHGRQGNIGERTRGEIGLHALRTGDNPGEHTVVFGMMGECLELTHRALNRDGFARGAIDAARFLVGRPPRLYDMGDLLA